MRVNSEEVVNHISQVALAASLSFLMGRDEEFSTISIKAASLQATFESAIST